MKTAPTTAASGRTRTCRWPTSSRTACGTTRPTKPTAPTTLTSTAVITAVTTSRASRVRATGMPREDATSSPKAKASRVRAARRQTMPPPTTTAAARAASSQRTPSRDPSSQNMTPRVSSESANAKTTRDVSAEKNCVPATPARMTPDVPPEVNRERSSTTAKATRAPMRAPPDRPTAPPPIPMTPMTTAPVEAPDETPRRNGSASGLRSSDCMTTPQRARPAPAQAATRARGRRSCQTIASLATRTGMSARPRWFSSTSRTLTSETSAGPSVRATPTETTSTSAARAVRPTPATAEARPGLRATVTVALRARPRSRRPRRGSSRARRRNGSTGSARRRAARCTGAPSRR